MNKVYVYGTLRPNNSETVQIPGKLYDLGWFPGGRVDESSESSFTCEVIELDDEALKRTDRYEGFYEHSPEDSLFVRKPILDGWIYEYNHEVSEDRRVKSGDWFEHKPDSRQVSFA